MPSREQIAERLAGDPVGNAFEGQIHPGHNRDRQRPSAESAIPGSERLWAIRENAAAVEALRARSGDALRRVTE